MKKSMLAPAFMLFGAFAMNGQNFQPPMEVLKAMSDNTCLTCHKMTERSVGPSYAEISKKKYSKSQILKLIKTPKPSNWPDYAPMVGLPNLPKADAQKIAAWIESLGK